MATHEKLIEVLNDLIEINNDRIKGFEKASEELDNESKMLEPVFSGMRQQSEGFKNELATEIGRLGGKLEDDSSALGALHRMWMDLRDAFSSNDGKTTLETAEFGEDAALKAYEKALSSDAEMNAETRQLITSQKGSLKQSHDTIRNLRDTAKAMA